MLGTNHRRALVLPSVSVMVVALLATSAGPVRASSSSTPLGNGCGPRPMVFPPDPAGRVWYGEGEGDIGRITGAGKVTETGVVPGQIGGVTTGPDGAVWFTFISPTGPRDNVGRIAANGRVTTFPVPALPNGGTADPGILVSGADGFLYTPIDRYPYAARISMSGTVTYLPLPSPAADMARGPDGAPWVTGTTAGSGQTSNGVIARLGSSGVTAEFTYLADDPAAPGSSIGWPRGLTAGPDGRLWFAIDPARQPNNHVGAVTTSGQFSFYVAATTPVLEEAIAPGPDANVWVLLDATPTPRIEEFDQLGNVVAQHSFNLLAGVPISHMAVGPGGLMWLNDYRYLYAISSDGTQTTVYPPAPSLILCDPYGPQVLAGQHLAVFGRALDQVTSVSIGGAALPFTVVSPAEVDVAIPTNQPSGDTTLVASGGGTSASLPGGLDIEATPSISSVSPNCGSINGGGGIEIRGTELDAVTSVTVGGSPASIDHRLPPSETAVFATTPQHLMPGTVDIRVTTIAGTSPVVPADQFTYSLLCT